MLPKTEHAIFQITIPSTKLKVNFRRFLAKEEKILLMAKQSDERIDKLLAMKQVINNCLVDTLDVDEFTTFDFDYVFLKLRANSVDSMAEVIFTDPEDNQEYPHSIDLNAIEVKFPENINQVIDVDGKIKIKLQFPTMGKVLAGVHQVREVDNIVNLDQILMEQCIGQIYDADTVYDDYSHEELVEWLDNLSLKASNEIKLFIMSIPDLEYHGEYKTKAGTVREVDLRGLEDFFML